MRLNRVGIPFANERERKRVRWVGIHKSIYYLNAIILKKEATTLAERM
jgi:ribosomal protein S6E (S10)